MPSLSRDEREAFLAEPRIAALSVAAGPDRAPFTLPIWYQYEPGGEPWIVTETGSRKARLIQVAIFLRPQRWLTADLGPGALPPGGPAAP